MAKALGPESCAKAEVQVGRSYTYIALFDVDLSLLTHWTRFLFCETKQTVHSVLQSTGLRSLG